MTEDRLDRIERILETAVSLCQQNREDIDRLTQELRTNATTTREDIARLTQEMRTNASANREDIAEIKLTLRNATARIDILSERIGQYITQSEVDRATFQAERELIRSEMRGLRTEVTRIAEHIFGQGQG
jgi:hypothetical protein